MMNRLSTFLFISTRIPKHFINPLLRSYGSFISESDRFSTNETTSKQYQWCKPSGLNTGISMFNSLTKEKNPLHLSNQQKSTNTSCDNDNNSLFLTWYSCGPTVYDHSHIGHARSYVQQDIALRILHNFNINVKFVMGLTDIDDKIINKTKDITSKDNVGSIMDVSRKYEESFWEDMDVLGVKRPHAITRVSEHMENIMEMIGKLYQNQFAYLGKDGSVYFDTRKYRNEIEEHPIPKQSSLTLDELIDSPESDPYKKHLADFALWKPSPDNSSSMKDIDAEWLLELKGGIKIKGRPGWHIECSAMCSKMFGGSLDVHAGGIDLLFPHHCNEVAQSLAYFTDSNNNQSIQWPNYFFHTGHLYIKGFKMSKSLKNFVTIKEFLKDYTPADMRWFCLLHHYRYRVDFSPDCMEEARNIQLKISNFLAEAKHLQKEYKNHFYWMPKDHELFSVYHESKVKFTEALLDDFDTPNAVQIIMTLIKTCNVHFQDTSVKIPSTLLYHISSYIESTLIMFGFNLHNYDIEKSDNNVINSNFISQLVDIRSDIRELALDKSNVVLPIIKSKLLALSDKIRDQLWEEKIQIQDRSSNDSNSIWRIVDKIEYENHKNNSSVSTKKNSEHQQHLLNNPPISMEEFMKKWKVSGEFSLYDEEGFPTHDIEGKEVSKSRSRKHRKQAEKHEKKILQFNNLVVMTKK